ncbi:LuxR family transcriptional regulator [Kitasatospora sp. MMS16-BH015]|uniref:response regulator transcription factor n=1 Tax=Kitasatospora sp. MMS16-BH015 TaxID=2018025 RepID=UPI000CA36EDE|nr:response regulator transcription factor [Kitasatospora sp. MMS16-BH015]AUG81607.1 LuxR family transcriptional regulator [Kitasatospora sp. MMS16-BH015]
MTADEEGVPVESGPTAPPIRVLLADDEESIRAGVRLILRQAEGVEVVAEAADGAEALELAARTEVDVALVDIRMPVLDGLAAIGPLLALDPHLAVVMLTTFGDEANVTRALASGATGFLLKDDSPQEIITAIRAAAAGDAVLSPAVTGMVVKRMLAATEPAAAAAAPGPLSPEQRVAALDERERQVLAMLGEGMPNLEICLRLGAGPDTVKELVDTVLERTGSDSRVKAALLAAQAGLTPR